MRWLSARSTLVTIVILFFAGFIGTTAAFYDWRRDGIKSVDARDAVKTAANVALAIGVCLTCLQFWISSEDRSIENREREAMLKVENEQRWVQNLIRLHELWQRVLDKQSVRDDLEYLAEHALTEADFLNIANGHAVSTEVDAARSRQMRTHFIAALNVFEIIVVAYAYKFADSKLVEPTLIEPTLYYTEKLRGFVKAWKQTGHKGWKGLDDSMKLSAAGSPERLGAS